MSIPHWIWILFWILIGILLLILAGVIIHWAGGGILELHAGHFIFELGAT